MRWPDVDGTAAKLGLFLLLTKNAGSFDGGRHCWKSGVYDSRVVFTVLLLPR